MLGRLGFFRNSKPPSPLLLQPSKLLLKPRDNAVAANKDASDTPFGRDHRRKHVMAQHAQSLLEKDDNDTKYEAAHFISNTSEQRYVRQRRFHIIIELSSNFYRLKIIHPFNVNIFMF